MTAGGRDDDGGRCGERRWSPWVGLPIGVAAALFGLLPWLVTGLRLPLQNLWATEPTATAMPRVLLPFSQYAITLVIGVLVTGAAVAGLIARTARRHLARWGVPAVVVGVLVVHVVALAQTVRVVHAGLSPRRESALYLAALVGVAFLSVLVGLLSMVLIAAAPPAGAVVGMSIGALALAPWLSGLLIPFGTLTPSPVTLQLLGLLRWLPAVLVGAAIGWAGGRTGGRVVAALLGLLLLWVVPALTTAISASAGSRVLARHPAEMAAYAGEVFTSALTRPQLALPPIVVALVVAAAGILGRHLRARREA